MSRSVKISLWLFAPLALLLLGYVLAAGYSAQAQVERNRTAAVVTCMGGNSQMRIEGMGLPILVRAGGIIPDGAQVSVPHGGELCLDIANRARLRVVGPAEFSADALENPARAELSLLSGRLYAAVQKLGPDEALLIHAAGRQAEVHGTRFEVDLYSVQYALSVVEGVVGLSAGGPELPVHAGNSANDAAGSEQPLSADAVSRIFSLSQIPAATQKELADSFKAMLLDGLPSSNPLSSFYAAIGDQLAPLERLAREGIDFGSGMLGDDQVHAVERTMETTLTLKGIRRAIQVYQGSFGELPADLENLGEPPDLLLDAWGRRYVYAIDPQARGGFRLFSKGLDGEEGTADDVY